MNYLFIYIGYILFIIADHLSNTDLLCPLMGSWIGYAIGDGIICLLFILSRVNRSKYGRIKRFYLLVAVILVTVTDISLSVLNVIDRNNRVKEVRQTNDPVLLEWKLERNRLFAADSLSRLRYQDKQSVRWADGAKAEREENAVITISRINHLNKMIADKEIEISKAGGRLNECIISVIPNQKVATIFLIFLGIIPPLGMQILGERHTELIEEKRKKMIGRDQVTKFWSLFLDKFVTNRSQIGHDQNPNAESNFPSQLLLYVAIGYCLEKYNGHKIQEIIQKVGHLIGRYDFDKSNVYVVKQNTESQKKKYRQIVDKNPLLTEKVYDYIRNKDQSKSITS